MGDGDKGIRGQGEAGRRDTVGALMRGTTKRTRRRLDARLMGVRYEWFTAEWSV
jgi:hypothetical protein